MVFVAAVASVLKTGVPLPVSVSVTSRFAEALLVIE